MTRRRLAAIVLLASIVVLAGGTTASAHPLGNFTTNTWAGLYITEGSVEVDYVVDLAEIPALQAIQRIDADGDGSIGEAEGEAYRAATCVELGEGLEVGAAGDRLALPVVGSSLETTPGQAGLETLRLECRFVAPVAVGRTLAISFVDGNFAGRVGWREIVARGDGTTLVEADVSEEDLSDRLRRYPEEQLSSPPVVLEASVVAEPGGSRLSEAERSGEDAEDEEASRGADPVTRRFVGLIDSRELTPAVAALGVLVALLAGAWHGVLPGHGKTVIAAYIIGRKRQRHLAVLLGLTVAVTHTAGVLVLALLITTSETVSPERAYPLLGALSGVLFAGLGAWLLATTLRRRRSSHGHVHFFGGGHDHHDDHEHAGHEHAGHEHHTHDHELVAVGAGGPQDQDPHDHGDHDHGDHDHGDHDHGDHDPHDHDHDDHLDHEREGAGGWKAVVLPGIAGGLVPSPSAVLVYTGGVSVGRSGFGLALVACYGLGLAGVLVGAGRALVELRGALERRTGPVWSRLQRLDRALPVLTAVAVIVGGVVIAVRALQSA